ncbi:MAG: hypothetical protein LBU97_03730 [Alistipes sp.]|jgi:hypothetical protein|nr:hypothetical protein [Alistipes sp.]
MRKSANSDVVEDIWMNTHAGMEDFDAAHGPDDAEGWDEVEEANALLNPDFESMESRG